MSTLHPQIVLHAYGEGLFPMAKSRSTRHVFWVDPHKRGILPLDHFHVPTRLARTMRSCPWAIRYDYAFEDVVHGCAEKKPTRCDTWLNQDIIDLHINLYRQGHAHSVECWDQENLVGGLYGISLGGVFFGESMFSRQRDASKIALCHLVRVLRQGGYHLLDIQFINQHLTQFGAVEIERDSYKRLLKKAMTYKAVFAAVNAPKNHHNPKDEYRTLDAQESKRLENGQTSSRKKSPLPPRHRAIHE